MILIADSGSTKCTWISVDGANVSISRTWGINALQHTAGQIRDALTELPRYGEVASVHFYGAGCGDTFPEATAKMTGILRQHFGTDRIDAQSDLLGAARALFGRGEGIACILGTGANTCWCREGRIIQNIPPLGYILGDEGSGAVMGRNLLNGIFKGHIPLREEFMKVCGLTYEEIIHRVYREPFANRFLASFAPFVRENLDCDEVDAMVEDTFTQFVDRNLSRYPKILPVGFVGGIASAFEPQLRRVVAACGYRTATITESPAEGLLKYHNGE